METEQTEDDSSVQVVEPRPLEAEDVKKGLSTLGVTFSRQHVYTQCDLQGLHASDIEAIRLFPHLQYINLSSNKLTLLEPLADVCGLLELNVSKNLLTDTKSFASRSLEICNMSYNSIHELGDWSIYKYLRQLSLRGNSISSIGFGLKACQELRVLDLSENQLEKLDDLEGLDLLQLFVSSNRLLALNGVETLKRLQVLDVSSNEISSFSPIDAEKVPRLRQLFAADNKISKIEEIKSLAAFDCLLDLSFQPNPVADLPHYRAQVLYRLPHIRLLDGEHVTAEERVKADVIYGSDIEARREIFESLLPKETFVDRRLVTAELIAQTEMDTFGCYGDAICQH